MAARGDGGVASAAISTVKAAGALEISENISIGNDIIAAQAAAARKISGV